MLDIKFIRENPDIVKKAIRDKGYQVDLDLLLKIDQEKRKFLKEIEDLRAQQKKTKNHAEAKVIKNTIISLEKKLKPIEDNFQKQIRKVPNLPASDVKIGKDESANEVIKTVGEKTKFEFKPKSYLTLAENLDLIDMERGARVSGSRFGYLKNELVLIQFALIQLAFDVLTKKGFKPILPPFLIKDEAMAAMGYLEQGGDQETYQLEKDKLYLIGTAEQALGPMHGQEILSEDDLPLRYVGYSACFRREAGSYGKDTKGILRVHQFDKVEMFSFTKPEQSDQEHEFLLKQEENLMQLLKIPYQVVKMCRGDLGVPAARKYDIEAFLPSENRYRETHSTSNCTDFQARRLNIRYKNNKIEKNELVHTLNGTALALGRTIIAILENYQQKDGSIKIPEVLYKYLGGLKEIEKQKY